LLPFPADIPPLETFMYWHANVDEDPAAQWFREKMLAVMRQSESESTQP
jgi:DNA-binding transcriptional LysR family regulator